MWAFTQVPVTPLWIQLTANMHGKTAEDDPTTMAPAIHREYLGGPALGVFAIVD